MLTVLNLRQSIEWDKIVTAFDNYDVFYLSGYGKSFESHGDGEPLLFYYEDCNGKAINVVMKRDIAEDETFSSKLSRNTYYDFVTPYGYGGWLIEGEINNAQLLDEYTSWCKANRIVSEFVRFHPVIGNQNKVTDFYKTVKLGATIAMDLSSPETIWENITSKNRNMIRKAEKNGIVIKRGNDNELYVRFKDIYNETMDRDNAEKYYYFDEEFYSIIRNELKDNAFVFYAENKDGKIIAASIILKADGKLSYHLSGSKIEYKNLAPTNLLLYQVALFGCENGYKSFHLGGGVGAREDSLFHFKKSFYRGEPCDYYVGKKVFDKEIYDKLTEINGKQSDFFPMYRSK